MASLPFSILVIVPGASPVASPNSRTPQPSAARAILICVDKPEAATRGYSFELDADQAGDAPLLSVFGGKITTYRKLAEHALDKLRPFFPQMRGPWTATGHLPGGDMPEADFERFFTGFKANYAFLPEPLARRLARAYGTRARDLLGSARTLADLGEDFGGGLTADFGDRHGGLGQGTTLQFKTHGTTSWESGKGTALQR